MELFVLLLPLKVKRMSRKLNNNKVKDKILKLRAAGKSYNQIVALLGCSKSTVSYHCGNGREKARVLEQVKNRKPICRKVSGFKTRCSRANYKNLSSKVKTFKSKSQLKGNRTNTVVNNISQNYTCQDVLNKFGPHPICYLTGKSINLDKPESYHLDHIVPTSRGGTNDLSNLQICVKEANTAKGQLFIKELYSLCEDILNYRDFLVKKEATRR